MLVLHYYFCGDVKKIQRVNSPDDYACFVNTSVLHPLENIIHYD